MNTKTKCEECVYLTETEGKFTCNLGDSDRYGNEVKVGDGCNDGETDEMIENCCDRDIEKLWESLEDVPTYFGKDFVMRLDEKFKCWDKGTDIEEIWRWFDEHHSKGVGWLMGNI